MAKGFKAQHFEDYSIVKGNVKVKLNLKQYGEKLQKAQYDLDGQIMNNMKPYMPYQAGTFQQQTQGVRRCRELGKYVLVLRRWEDSYMVEKS